MMMEDFDLYLSSLFRLFEQRDLPLVNHLEEDLRKVISKSVTQDIHRRLGLTLDARLTSSNVCYVTNNQEIRDEYKQYISLTEFLYFLYGTFKLNRSKTLPTEGKCWPNILPGDMEIFWNRMRLGEDAWEKETS